MKLRHFARISLIGALALLVASGASAQTNTIRFIIGTAPGGAIDPYARLVAEPMSKALGQTVIVEYKPGANGNNSG